MRLPIDTAGLMFMLVRDAEPVRDFETKQVKADPDGVPLFQVDLVAFGDDAHVDAQRAVYHRRLVLMRDVLAALGVECPLPEGAFYLWAPAPGGDAWGLAHRLATEGGAVVSPGEFYGDAGSDHVRIAVVQPDDRLALVARRLGA